MPPSIGQTTRPRIFPMTPSEISTSVCRRNQTSAVPFLDQLFPSVAQHVSGPHIDQVCRDSITRCLSGGYCHRQHSGGQGENGGFARNMKREAETRGANVSFASDYRAEACSPWWFGMVWAFLSLLQSWIGWDGRGPRVDTRGYRSSQFKELRSSDRIAR